MAPVAERLSDDQINAVSAYFASVPQVTKLCCPE